jgi:hypothetical protein
MTTNEKATPTEKRVLKWYLRKGNVFYLMSACMLLLASPNIPLILASDRGKYYYYMDPSVYEMWRALIAILVILTFMTNLKLSDRPKCFYRITVQTFTAFVIFCFTAFALYVLVGNFL